MAAATPSFVPGRAGTKEAHMASIPVSLSCPHHVNPHTELPNPSPGFAHARTKALIQGGTAGLIHYTAASLSYYHACTAEAERCQHSARKDFVLVLAGVQLIFFIVAGMVLCFGFVLKTVLITQGCFPYC